MKYTATDIAMIIGGTIIGDPDRSVNYPATLETAKEANITFYANEKYEAQFLASKAGIILIDENIELKKDHSATLIKCTSAFESFTTLIQQLSKGAIVNGIDPSSIIHETAQLGNDIYIGPNVVISAGVQLADSVQIHANSFIGNNVIIGEGSIIKSVVNISNAKIGKNCIIHSGVVIGSDGFGFIPKKDQNQKVPHIGDVLIHDEVEVGANTTIDRGSIGSTIIGKGVKLDNLIQIAHNVEIGELTMIAAQTGIAGSTKIGKKCLIGGQVGIVGHIQISDEVKIAAQSGILSRNSILTHFTPIYVIRC